MSIENAKKIDGYMTELELTWLAKQAKDKKNIIEVGSWKGRSTRAIADSTSGIIIAVDTFAGTENEGEAHREAFDNGPEYMLDLFKSNLAPHIETGKVTPLQSSSVEAAAILLEKHGQIFDMIFIDADHKYPGVNNDIKAYMPLLKKGGLFCGHDYYYGDVTRAVKELVPTHKAVEGASIWYVKK